MSKTQKIALPFILFTLILSTTTATASHEGKESKEISYSARKLGLKTGVGKKVYAKLHNALESLPNGLKVKRIREGADSTKIAVIGRKMPGVVDDTAAHLRKSGAKVTLPPKSTPLVE